MCCSPATGWSAADWARTLFSVPWPFDCVRPAAASATRSSLRRSSRSPRSYLGRASVSSGQLSEDKKKASILFPKFRKKRGMMSRYIKYSNYSYLFLAATLRVRSFPIGALLLLQLMLLILLLRVISRRARGMLAQLFGQVVNLLLKLLASYFQILDSHGLAGRAQIVMWLSVGISLLRNVAQYRNFSDDRTSVRNVVSHGEMRSASSAKFLRNFGSTAASQSASLVQSVLKKRVDPKSRRNFMNTPRNKKTYYSGEIDSIREIRIEK